LVTAPDQGIYDAINKGISRATGDIIGLMHSDDFFASDHVLEQVAQAFQDPVVDGVYGDLQYVSANEPNKIIRHWKSGEYHPSRLKQGWMPPHPTLYVRREVFEKWGTYDTSYSIAADYDAMLRYLAKGKIKLSYIPEVLVKMRVGGESNRSVGRIIQKSREDYLASRQHGVGGIGTLLRKNTSKIRQFF
jgi:glycosyltransferase involved in cell wall biosynthesis